MTVCKLKLSESFYGEARTVLVNPEFVACLDVDNTYTLVYVSGVPVPYRLDDSLEKTFWCLYGL